VFSRSLIFATIPKACGFEAATLSTSILLGGSLIPIVVYWDGDGFSWLNTYPAFAGMTALIGQFELILVNIGPYKIA
jgi:hypothetical protein